ncbi:hypothetical protein CFK39_07960 [Brachybacterium avium]|uniref:DoxX family protein n=1 Tax=Brachybacterium avium TaxID=2017485 RepID=A0A220UCZ4_9MICO|nr:DoxX family membrane protein [Brachybacterium avium]ASK65782.1 hypothetical protein CFK39_07960 [Brachybacterium avium]
MSVLSPSPSTSLLTRARQEPAFAAFWVLRLGFVVLPLLMGLDKFTNLLTDWPGYLAPWMVALLPVSAQTAMYVIGVIEIVAGIAVALRPRLAAWVVAAWLAGIIVNLLTYSGFYDVALRDVGLLVAAIALGLLSRTYDRPQVEAGA